MVASWLPPLHLNRILGGRSCYISAQIRPEALSYLEEKKKHPTVSGLFSSHLSDPPPLALVTFYPVNVLDAQ